MFAEASETTMARARSTPRSLWTGSISFGLVNVPVRVFSAVLEHKLRFHLVHAKDDGQIGYEKVCKVEGKHTIDLEDFVPYEQIDPTFFARAYLVGPQEGAERAYSLLVHAMEDSG